MGNAIAVDFVTRTRTDAPPKKPRDHTRDRSALHRAPVDPAAVEALKKRLARERSEEGRRSYAMLLLLLTTGMRASELVRLTRSDFRRDDQGHVLSFYRPKVKSRHVIRLSEETHRKIKRALDAYHKAAGLKGKDSEHIFWSAQNRRAGLEVYVHHTKLTTRSLQRIVNAWGLIDGRGKLIAPHALRHHVGRNVSRRKDFIYAQKLLGHSDPKTTAEFYTDKSVQALEV